ncbi:MFS transporter, sugar porter (SP) family [Georgenia satyanarayanai]|uniref:MFS transporter, sugar porter (SP) family n=1 Tax=Georgenia satyanarayanai TaxID=860221 RepID=A0A2Y9C7R5_9MICO|nr:sugar porter family MFS transporter [Georgenia satyanarayanai]PYF96770.1 sugar porter (SP) family MFS transporter [Georgenia satyanarayanai]SSA46513.1 MFS transporter, sugar porter (SP) family [Georgenia satyanarayanai]
MSDKGSTMSGRILGISLAAAMGGFLFGFDTAVINGAIDAMSEDFGISGFLQGFAVSSALLGCVVGAWFAGPLASRQGRVRVMIVAAVLFAISAIGSGLAFGTWDLIAWRVLGGLGVGAASVIAPAYIAEVSPADVRGRLGSLQQLAIVLGIFAALLSDAFLAGTAGGAAEQLWLGREAWRWMFMAEAVPATIYGLLALTIPESPRYLVDQHREEEAAEVLKKYTGVKDTAAKIKEIHQSLTREARESLSDLKGHSLGLKPIVWVGIVLAIFQQFVGINVIFYYSTTLWRSVGFEESQALTTSVITSVTNVLVTVVAILLVDKVGRRPLLIFGSVGMTVSLATMSLAFSQAQGTGEDVSLPQPWATVALVAANLFVVSFGATWGPIMWVMLGEMFPNKIRATAIAVASAVNWLANFTVSTTFPTLSEISLSLAYGIYALSALLSLGFVLWQVPETKGRELEDMTDEGRTRKART